MVKLEVFEDYQLDSASLNNLSVLCRHYFFFLDYTRGAALLVEAADMGDADAQYELGCRLRVEVRLCILFV